jgi:biopolymer transport protein ExbD
MLRRNRLLRIFLIVTVCPLSMVSYAQQPDTSNKTYYKSTLVKPKYEAPTEVSKTATEKKDLIINTKMDTLSVIFQNTLIPIRSFSQLDSFIRGNLIGIAKPRVEIRGYPGDTYENFDKVVAILKKNKISDFSLSMAPAAP